MTFTEFTSAVKNSFAKELAVVDEKFEGDDALAAFIDAIVSPSLLLSSLHHLPVEKRRADATSRQAEVQGFPNLDAKTQRRKARKEPLASAFANLIRLDPKLPTVSTWQILFCLDESVLLLPPRLVSSLSYCRECDMLTTSIRRLADVFERQSDTKTRLSRKLVEVLVRCSARSEAVRDADLTTVAGRIHRRRRIARGPSRETQPRHRPVSLFASLLASRSSLLVLWI